MHTPFEVFLDRRHGDSQKWNKYPQQDILPLWIADMDCTAPPAVISALKERVEHGCFGYAKPYASLIETVVNYLNIRYGWKIQPEWLVFLPGLVTGLNLACRIADGASMVTPPVYPPFLSAPRFSGRGLVSSALIQGADGAWHFDFESMESTITEDTRLFILCHPHNPVGRAWRQDELLALATFCLKHRLIVCSDEIHCDLILEPRAHIPFATLGAEIAEETITLMAPSKTYNIPGLGCSFAVISNEALRQKFIRAMQGIVPDINVLGLVAGEAALRDGQTWLQALIERLTLHRDTVEAAISKMPKLSITHVEATYLAWIDARKLNLPNPASFFEAAGVGLSDGKDFGAPGFLRLNFAAHLSTLQEALQRMEKALASID